MTTSGSGSIMKDNGQLRSKKSRLDDSIMGTNSSSIVSKRSVERLYYPNEPHFFRYFVKKPQRRAPLINRGYWLRMKAIDHVVGRFLRETTEKKKIVINLGCGYDPLPWQSWARYPDLSRDVTFVDIDYRDLILKKRHMVQQTCQLNGSLKNLEFCEDGDVLLRSEQYLQIGCDLRDLTKLKSVLTLEFDMSKCVAFCTAEVSIAYMDVETSDALIKWIGSLPNARFCLLEQIIPAGPNHPFAMTMLAHFDKLQTPLRPVLAYPTTQDQENRFKKAGWVEVHARNLWQLWGSSDFLSSEDRMRLDNIEPFDEWEEFALFGCHYTLVEASNVRLFTSACLKSTSNTELPVRSGVPDSVLPGSVETTGRCDSGKVNLGPVLLVGKMASTDLAKTIGMRRFGAPLSVKSANGCPDLKGNFAGMGVNNRLNSMDVFSPPSQDRLSQQSHMQCGSPESRMCHTLTEIGDSGSLLVGGRSSPDKALADCWLYSKLSHTWERVNDIPVARYRHSAFAIGDGSVLVTGGKKDSKTVLSDTFLWNRQTGWIECPDHDCSLKKDKPQVFGALMISDFASKMTSRDGFLIGGMSADGRVSTDLWSWELRPEHKYPRAPSIRWVYRGKAAGIANLYLHRFGASWANCAGQLLLVGGIISDGLVPERAEIVALEIESETGQLKAKLTDVERCGIRPLLIGHSVITSGGSLLIMGGGAVCFSFGTFWNSGCYTVSLDDETDNDLETLSKGLTDSHEPWQYLNTVDAELSNASEISKSLPLKYERPREPLVIARKKISSSTDFAAILSVAEPVILECLDLGSCTDLWTNSYLVDRIGHDRNVTVHQASVDHMDFTSKNFQYVTRTFNSFIDAIDKGERLYLRSLAFDKPSEVPADISRDFPTISRDFHLPPELAMVRENKHSSPLRISGPVAMWLHYDVMSNVLCQIRGQKRLLLFPPSDVQYFDFAPGVSSSSIDAFGDLTGCKAAASHPREANLNPGDVLFLPPLWLHTAKPLNGVSVSVNVFFRDLQNGYAAGKDVYGNRDLQPYEKGRQDITRICKTFESLPPDARKFYLLRLVDELEQMARLA